MNIWYLSAHDQPNGQSSRTYDYSRHLVKRGHRVTMFTNSYCHWTRIERLSQREKWRIEEIDGIRVVWLRTRHYSGNRWSRGGNMISNAWRCIQVSRALSDRPDVVIGPSVPLGTGWAASLIARSKKAAFVFEVRDVWPEALVDSGGLSNSSPVYHAFRLIEKSLYHKSDRISSTLPFIHHHVFESGGDPGKVMWIPNGVDFERLPNGLPYDGGTRRPLVVMYVGGFGAEHDVFTIVEVARLVQQAGDGLFHFVMVGNGIKQPECQRLAALHRLTNIEFRAPVPKAEVPSVLSTGDILIASIINSAVYRFGINLNKLYDYAAAGRPVIFAGHAPNDLVKESRSGFSVPPEDPHAIVAALDKLLNMTAEERQHMGQRGRQYAEMKFDLRKLGGCMESLLLDSIKQGSN